MNTVKSTNLFRVSTQIAMKALVSVSVPENRIIESVTSV